MWQKWKNFCKASEQKKQFLSLDNDWHNIVFYAEDAASYGHFDKIIDYLTQTLERIFLAMYGFSPLMT